MTNLNPETPRRSNRVLVLLGLPILFGVLIAAGVLWSSLMPTLSRWMEQRQRIEYLSAQQARIDALEDQLQQSEAEGIKVQKQQDLLVDLIASRDRIQTFLAQLGREALASGVTLELYEPAVPLPPAAGSQGGDGVKRQQPDGSAEAAAVPSDPLANRGYQKTSVLLRARGPYSGLQIFLRRMEGLTVLVSPSDLALRAIAAEQGEEGQPRAATLTELKLRLNFYDKLVPAAKQAASQSEEQV
ncbi:MAG: hypothetical protein AB8E87_13820 [Prochlorococcus sp.]|nr:hypothetical protein [Prochlorococcaceae cyanobacterium Fu_MAG_50]